MQSTLRNNLFLQSLQHVKNSILGKNRLKGFNRKNVASRIDTDGLLQTKYKLISKMRNELFTKFTVHLLYDKDEDHELMKPYFKPPLVDPRSYLAHPPLNMYHSHHTLQTPPLRSFIRPYDFPNVFMFG